MFKSSRFKKSGGFEIQSLSNPPDFKNREDLKFKVSQIHQGGFKILDSHWSKQ